MFLRTQQNLYKECFRGHSRIYTRSVSEDTAESIQGVFLRTQQNLYKSVSEDTAESIQGVFQRTQQNLYKEWKCFRGHSRIYTRSGNVSEDTAESIQGVEMFLRTQQNLYKECFRGHSRIYTRSVSEDTAESIQGVEMFQRTQQNLYKEWKCFRGHSRIYTRIRKQRKKSGKPSGCTLVPTSAAPAAVSTTSAPTTLTINNQSDLSELFLLCVVVHLL